MEASAIPARANRYRPNENTPRPLCGLSPVQRAPVGANSGALRANESRSAHSCTTATSGASANNASILRWKPDRQFHDMMRILATDIKLASRRTSSARSHKDTQPANCARLLERSGSAGAAGRDSPEASRPRIRGERARAVAARARHDKQNRRVRREDKET